MQVRVLDRQQVVFSRDFSGRVELGRQNDAGEELYSSRPLEGGTWRAVIARLDEDTLSRHHALLEPLPDGRVRVTNLSGKVPIRLGDGGELGSGKSCELALPAVLAVGRKTVRLQAAERREPSLRSLPPGPPPGQVEVAASRFPTMLVHDAVAVTPLLGWLRATMGVLQSAASSSDFFQKAAQAVVDIVGCDGGRVLLLEGGTWRVAVARAAAAVGAAAGGPDWQPSHSVLERVREEKRTFWQGPEQADPVPAESLVGVTMVVAAPILDRDGTVIGALYGDCREVPGRLPRPRITDLEAMLVELLASGVSTGLARLEQEKAAVESDIRFSQFFTKELSRQLALHPDMLKGRDSEVTVLFCDVRAFSRISERLGPARTVEWVSDVMGALSDCVLERRGVLVDYVGDELMAMWGAPEEQPDHARLACRAALDMLNLVPKLNEHWGPVLGEAMAVGVGINTGVARVGNVGSRQKFKYGPLGHTVNLASRVQGATKYLRARLLVTESTQARLGEGFATRRLGKVRAVNMDRPVDLYELVAQGSPGWQEVKARYEEALAEFEQGRLRAAGRLLGKLLAQHADDGPTLVLLARALMAGSSEPATSDSVWGFPARFDPVWELPGK
jgi:adenylate cyclase